MCPCYAQIHKDIVATYACCGYGKQYEELLQNAKHLGQRWYAIAKFCETRSTQSELMVYKNFKKNYNSYRKTWSGDAVGVEPEPDAATIVAQTTTAQREVAA